MQLAMVPLFFSIWNIFPVWPLFWKADSLPCTKRVGRWGMPGQSWFCTLLGLLTGTVEHMYHPCRGNWDPDWYTNNKKEFYFRLFIKLISEQHWIWENLWISLSEAWVKPVPKKRWGHKKEKVILEMERENWMKLKPLVPIYQAVTAIYPFLNVMANNLDCILFLTIQRIMTNTSDLHKMLVSNIN